MKDWLDNYLNNRLSDVGQGLDLDQAWNQLEAQRQKPRKKRGFIFWLLLVGGLSSGFGFGQLLHPLPSAGSQDPTLAVSSTATSTHKSLLPHEESPCPSGPSPAQEAFPKKYSSSKTALRSVASPPTLQIEPPSMLSTLSIPIKSQEKAFSFPAIPPTTSRRLVPLPNKFLPELPYHSARPLASSISSSATFDRWSLLGLGDYGILRTSGLLGATPVDIIGGTMLIRHAVQEWLWIETGFQYQQLSSRTHFYKKTVKTQTLEDQVLAYVQYSDGTTGEQRGVLTIQTTTEETFQGWQKHRLLSIPVRVGVSLPILSSARIGLQVGGTYGIFAWHQGMGIAPENGQRLPLNELDLRQQGFVGLSGGLFWEQNLSSQWALHLGANGTTYLSGWGLAFAPRHLQVQLGLRRSFGR